MYQINFEYNEKGFGNLELCSGGTVEISYRSRTGSIGSDGKLKNAMPAGEHWIRTESVDTVEIGMVITPGKGWKIRLWQKLSDTKYGYRGLLIHPDGNLPGTLGCIGIIKKDALDLRKRLDEILLNGKISIIVS